MYNKSIYEGKLLERIKKDDIVNFIKDKNVQIISMRFQIKELGNGHLLYYVNDKILFYYGGRGNKNVIQINLT